MSGSPGNPYYPDPNAAAWPSPFPWLSFGFTGPVPGFALSVVTPPGEEPVTAAQAKANARVDHAADDALWDLWVTAARQMVEQETAQRFVSQTLKLALPWWPTDGLIRLPVSPVSAVNALRYYDPSGTLTTLAPTADYAPWLAYRPPLVYPAPGKYWPAAKYGLLSAVEVEFVAGYGAAADVPAFAKQAILLACTYWNENRGTDEAPGKLGLPEGARRLIRMLSAEGYR